MQKRARERRAVAGAVLLAVAVSGCTYIRNMQAMDRERMLSAAGFQMKLADTPEKLEKLQALPQRKLTPRQKDGQIFYVYADAGYCKCIYVGNERAYQEYQRLALEKQIADEEREAAAMNEQASMDWGAWGPWGPWR